MSANVLGSKKTRKLAAMTGLDIDRAVVWSNHDSGRLANARTTDDVHYCIDRRTGEIIEDASEFDTLHFSSCGAER